VGSYLLGCEALCLGESGKGFTGVSALGAGAGDVD
jgi:hypothetical protein